MPPHRNAVRREVPYYARIGRQAHCLHRGGASSRDQSRLVAACRDMSRQVGTGRGWTHLPGVGNVLVDRSWRNKVLLAERRFDEAAFEMTLSAVSLDTAGRAGKTGTGVAF